MSESINKLLEVMSSLRNPESGCPWDLQQTFESIIPYTLEETYEVIDAIESKNFSHVQDELGDLLFQVVFYARMGEEQNLFDFEDVVEGITDKLLRRHPHIFGDATDQQLDAGQVARKWEEIKRSEIKPGNSSDDSILAGIPLALPALQRGQKLQKKASRAGFDWPDFSPVLEKLDEEVLELKEEVENSLKPQTNEEKLESRSRILEELGDIIFTAVNLARHLDADAETVARQANMKFEKRFRGVEQVVKDHSLDLKSLSIDELERLWQQQKTTG